MLCCTGLYDAHAAVLCTHLPYVLNRCSPRWQATLISHATTISSGAADRDTARSRRLKALHGVCSEETITKCVQEGEDGRFVT
jgi:hypothetical protein